MAGEKGKRILIHLSSSSDDDESNEESCSDSTSQSSGDEFESTEDDVDDDDDVYEVDESEVDEDDDDGEEDDSFDNGRQGVEDDENCLYNRVIQLLQEKRDLQDLSLKACKAYLRRHGLRMTGNKDVCLQRVQEHWRIKDGKAEVLYPRSSFVINCTGDVCKGDIVLFTQKVYGSFDKVTRSGKLVGKRTVAGRVVKESYGAAKQQHTFTVEVLWSKGMKKLPRLFPLLVKGRNLYRMKTYRLPWKNERERNKVLAEKHKRGAVARLKRAKRNKSWSTDKGGKSRKTSHSTRPSQMSSDKRGKHVDRNQRASSSKYSTTNCNYQQPDVKKGAVVRTKPNCSKPFLSRQKPISPKDRVLKLHPHHRTSQEHLEPLVGSRYGSMAFGSTAAGFRNEIPHHGSTLIPAARYNGFILRPFFHDSYHNQSPWMTQAESCQFFPSRTSPREWQNGFLRCSVPGCKETGSNGCIISACWRCCRRQGMRCNVHR